MTRRRFDLAVDPGGAIHLTMKMRDYDGRTGATFVLTDHDALDLADELASASTQSRAITGKEKAVSVTLGATKPGHRSWCLSFFKGKTDADCTCGLTVES
jgi:hypothetical protein